MALEFPVGRNFCENFVLDNKNFQSGKNFEVENFKLLTMIFSENFLSVENDHFF